MITLGYPASLGQQSLYTPQRHTLFKACASLHGRQPWSRYYLPDEITNVDESLHIIENEKETDSALQVTERLAPIAGRIGIRCGGYSEHHKTVFGSGFWIEQEYFITCAHLLCHHMYTRSKCVHPHHKEAEEDGRDVTPIECEDHLRSETHTQCRVCVRSKAGEPSFENDNIGKHDPFVKLWAYSIQDDLAIFRLRKDGHSDRVPHSVKIDQLKALPRIHPQDQSKHYIFVIAYSGGDLQFTSEYEKISGVADCKLKDEVFGQLGISNPETSGTKVVGLYEYMQACYFAVLKRTPQGRQGKYHNIEGERKKWKFNQIFIANWRAIAVGRRIGDEDDLLQVELEVEKGYSTTRRRYTRDESHTISAFHGCSGGPIAMIGEDLKPKVVGLMAAGDYNRPVNITRAFTNDGIEWIKNAIGKTSSVDASQA